MILDALIPILVFVSIVVLAALAIHWSLLLALPGVVVLRALAFGHGQQRLSRPARSKLPHHPSHPKRRYSVRASGLAG